MYDPKDLLRCACRDFILDNATLEEQIAFVEDQIRNPFDSSDNNYMKKLADMAPGADMLDDICAKFITQIQDVYPHLVIDLSEYDQRLWPLFMAIYKFFVKNISKMTYIFIREYLYNNKNRKGLVGDFMTTKVSSYPKEQYGKKEYYILITKLPQIVKEIFEDDVTLKDILRYIGKSESAPVYMEKLQTAIDDGIIVDKGVAEDLYAMFQESEKYREEMNRLEMDITQTFIMPYLEENGMMTVRLPQVEEIPEDDGEDGDEDGDD